MTEAEKQEFLRLLNKAGTEAMLANVKIAALTSACGLLASELVHRSTQPEVTFDLLERGLQRDAQQAPEGPRKQQIDEALRSVRDSIMALAGAHFDNLGQPRPRR